MYLASELLPQQWHNTASKGIEGITYNEKLHWNSENNK